MLRGRGRAGRRGSRSPPSRRSAALNLFGRAWLAAYGARKAARGLLDFDDMIDRAKALLGRARHRRLGALAARRRPRPHPGRRGAGHQPGAVAGDRRAVRRVLRRPRRPRRPAHDLRRRRREAVDLQLPGRRPGGVRRQARATSRACSTGSATRSQHCDLLYSFRSAPPILQLVDAVFAGPAGEGSTQAVAHHAERARPAGPGRAVAVPAEAREAGGRADWDEPAHGRRARRPGRDGWRARSPARSAAGSTPAARCPATTAEPIRAGDVMVLVQRRGADLRRGDPRAEAGAACRSPAPTCCGSAASWRSATWSRRCASPRRRPTTCRSPPCCAARSAASRERELFELAHGRAGPLWPALRDGAGRPLAGGARAARRPARPGRLPAARSSC